MITFFKPNKLNKGALASFKLVHKQNKEAEKHKEGCVWLALVKQVAWNDESKTGSFKNGETLNIKFNIIELGGFIDAIESGRPFDTYHSAKDKVGIKFGPYVPQGADKPVGFSLQAVRDRDGERTSFGISFKFGELKTLREFLRLAIQQILMSNYADEKKRFKEYTKQQGIAEVNDDEEDNIELPAGVEGEEDDDNIPLF